MQTKSNLPAARLRRQYACVLLGVLVWTNGQAAARFGRQTDNIVLNSTTLAGTAATFEAWLQFDCNYSGFGFVYCEWESAAEDKHLRVGPNRIEAFAFKGPGTPPDLTATVNIQYGVPHHVAYVYDGSVERLYLDGNLVTNRAAAGTIRDNPSTAALGYYNREPYTSNGFRGYLYSVRVSSVARYNGTNVSLPPLQMEAELGTELLLNCNSSCVFSSRLPYPCPGFNCFGATAPSNVSVVPSTKILLRAGTNNQFSLQWDAPFILKAASTVLGPFENVVGAQNPYLINIHSAEQSFFRLDCP